MQATMFKTDLTFRRFLDTFVPGFITTIFIWYIIIRPYFNDYFPSIIDESSTELKIIIILVISIFIGLIINHFSDFAVAFLYPRKNTEKNDRNLEKMRNYFYYKILKREIIDPREKAIIRVLNSSRKEIFIELLQNWIYTNPNRLKRKKEEKIIAHQHICARLRSLNDLSNKEYYAILSEVNFIASLTLSFSLLFFFSLILIILYFIPNIDNAIEFKSMLPIFILITLLLGSLIHALRRRFRLFSNQVIVLAIHFYSEDKKMYKK